MTNDPQPDRSRREAVAKIGDEFTGKMLRTTVLYAHGFADPEERDARVTEMGAFIRTAARMIGEDAGVALDEAEQAAVADAIAVDARAALALKAGRA